MKAKIISVHPFSYRGTAPHELPEKCLWFEAADIVIRTEGSKVWTWRGFDRRKNHDVLNEVDVPEDLFDKASALLLAEENLDAMNPQIREILR